MAATDTAADPFASRGELLGALRALLEALPRCDAEPTCGRPATRLHADWQHPRGRMLCDRHAGPSRGEGDDDLPGADAVRRAVELLGIGDTLPPPPRRGRRRERA